MKKILTSLLIMTFIFACACSLPNETSDDGLSATPTDKTVLDIIETKPDTSDSTFETDNYSTSAIEQTILDTQSETQNSPENDAPDTQTIALTFDDGPSIHTERLLNVFKKHGGKGTFFVVGNIAANNPHILKRMINEGHEIGNHTWSHISLVEADYQEALDQIVISENTINSITGVPCKLVRPPYGAFNSDVAAIGEELGVTFIGWSFDTRDWQLKDAQFLYDEIVCRAKDGDIILLHDLHQHTVDAMESVIPQLLDSGYELVTVSELMKHKGKTLFPGVFYSN